LSYRDLWLLSLPIYTLCMVAVLLIFSNPDRDQAEKSMAPTLLFAVPLVALLSLGIAAPSWTEPTQAEVSASGQAIFETGPWYGDDFQEARASIQVAALDQGGRVTPLPPHDEVRIEAEIDSGSGRFVIRAAQPIVNDPIGEHTTWWGVGTNVDHHGRSGIGTDKLPNIDSELAVFALGEIERDGKVVASGVPIHVMTANSGLPSESRLELDVGREGLTVPGLPDGHLRVLWSEYEGGVPSTGHAARYLIGSAVLLLMLVGALALNRRGNPFRRKTGQQPTEMDGTKSP
jgi:hypothetical protein